MATSPGLTESRAAVSSAPAAGESARRWATRPGQANEPQEKCAEALTLLHKTSPDLSAEAAALEMELGTRYGIPATNGAEGSSGEADIVWQQVSDLLAVYYFDVYGDFRGDELKRTQKGEDALHSGLDLQPVSRTLDNLLLMRCVEGHA